MTIKHLIRTLVLAALWGMAASTWSAIGHHLLGLPDLGIPSVAVAVATVLAIPMAPLRPRSNAKGYLEVAQEPRPGN